MKKIFLMFIVTIIVLCTGCTAQNKVVEISETLAQLNSHKESQKRIDEVMACRQTGALLYEPHGEYNLTGYNSKVYTFDAPNDFYEVVMLDDDSEDCIFIIHNTGARGISFQTIIYQDGAFYGLTSKYVLFQEPDGSITAVSIKEKEHCQIGEYCHEVKSFEELPNEEQESAIYPNGYYQCEF